MRLGPSTPRLETLLSAVSTMLKPPSPSALATVPMLPPSPLMVMEALVLASTPVPTSAPRRSPPATQPSAPALSTLTVLPAWLTVLPSLLVLLVPSAVTRSLAVNTISVLQPVSYLATWPELLSTAPTPVLQVATPAVIPAMFSATLSVQSAPPSTASPPVKHSVAR